MSTHLSTGSGPAAAGGDEKVRHDVPLLVRGARLLQEYQLDWKKIVNQSRIYL
jgi:hypothetical protein